MLTFIFPLVLIAASAIASYVILSRQALSLSGLAQQEIDGLYLNFAFFFKQLGHYGYISALLVMRRVVIISKALLTLVEKKFSRLIDSVHGKGMVTKRGSVSLFLTTISKK